jgi:membrane-bound lytic murein transglycosylase C
VELDKSPASSSVTGSASVTSVTEAAVEPGRISHTTRLGASCRFAPVGWLAAWLLLIAGCSADPYTAARQAIDVVEVVAGDEPLKQIGERAGQRVREYAENPVRLEQDLAGLRALIGRLARLAGAEWGEDEAHTPTPRRYVKYSDGYLSRAEVDFDRGVVTVETIVKEKPLVYLREAIIKTLLTPSDPRSVDLFSDDPVAIGGRPYLADQVVDHEGKAILYEWRAGRFADHLLGSALRQEAIETPRGRRTRYAVDIAMVGNHLVVRAGQYQPLVERYASRYGISRTLINAIIKTESDFNPYAVSSAPAFGLMQVVPTTAGRDATRVIEGRSRTPQRNELFDPETNIHFGTAYLSLLDGNYLAKVDNPLAREYCTIAAYNGGIGTVLRGFDRDRKRAFAQINSLSPAAVYRQLKERMPQETRRYLDKVLRHKRLYAGA